MKNKKYNWSDALLLLSIIYASNRESGATLGKIIAAGDWINHAVLNEDEFESGLARLTAGGFIREKNNVFFATLKVRRAYAKTTSPGRAVSKELSDIEQFIGAVSPTSAQSNINNLKYSEFSHEAFREAVDKHLTPQT